MSNDAELSKRALRFEVGEGVERYRRVVEGGAGRIIFIGGSPGSGRTLLLRTLEEELDRVVPRPVVVAGGFFRGEYEPLERSASKAVAATERAKAVISGVTALGAPFAGVVPYGPLAISAGRLATQLLSASVVLRKLLPTQEAVDRAAGTALELKALLRRAAEERPVVCLLDDLDQSHGRVWWASLIQSFALEVANGLPLLILVTVSDARVASEDEDAVGSLEALAARLEARDVAERWQLHATSIDAVRDWLDPCSSDIAELLVEATRGRPGWIAELWSEWVRTGTVQRFDAVSSWMFIEEPAAAEPARVLIDIVDERLEQLVGHDLVLGPCKALPRVCRAGRTGVLCTGARACA
ncbi:MAG: AAA family ATPase [Gaiellaceae bacterium]